MFNQMVNLTAIRTFSIFVIVSIVVGLSVRALLVHNVFGSKVTLERTTYDVDLTLKNITYSKTSEGVALWTLVAESATQSQGDGIIRVNNVQVFLFDKKSGNIEITADHGTLSSVDKTLTFSSNVVVENPSGNTLQTDYLEYDQGSNIAQSDKQVKITIDDIIVRGKGMQFDVAKRSLVLLGDVNALSRAMDNN